MTDHVIPDEQIQEALAALGSLTGHDPEADHRRLFGGLTA